MIKPMTAEEAADAKRIMKETANRKRLMAKCNLRRRKELAKEIIEEVKDQLRCRADAFDLKSSYRAIEKILREHVATYKRE